MWLNNVLKSPFICPGTVNTTMNNKTRTFIHEYSHPLFCIFNVESDGFRLRE